MNDNDGSRGSNLEETARQQNSNLRRLIDTIGSLIAASQELLRQLTGAAKPPQADRARPRDADNSSSTDQREP